jgi:hypothetical protein
MAFQRLNPGSAALIAPVLQAYEERYVALGSVSSGTYDLDLSLSNLFTLTLSSNVTFTFTNPPASDRSKPVTIVLTQGTGGNKTATFTNARYTDGTAPILSTGAGNIDVLTFFTINNGSSYLGTFAMADVK